MLSKDYTVKKFVEQAFGDLNLDKNNSQYVMRFELVNRIQMTIASLFYDLMSKSYMTKTTITSSVTRKYSVSGRGTLTIATLR